MAHTIVMPDIAPGTASALVAWLVEVGERVAAGSPIAEVESDKAVVEVVADASGVVSELLVAAGTEGIGAGTPLVRLSSDDAVDAAPATEKASATESSAAPALPEPAAPPSAPAPRRRVVSAGPAAGGGQTRVEASALARRVAALAGLRLDTLVGASHETVGLAAIEAVLGRNGAGPVVSARPTPAAPTPARTPELPTEAPAAPASPDLVPHSRMRRVIAERMQAAKREAPHFYLTMDCRADGLLSMRHAVEGATGEVRVTLNDIVIRATAQAMRAVPEANASWHPDGMLVHDSVDVAVAVAIPDGLVTPVIRAADTKGIVDISREMRDLAARARTRDLAPHEYRGGTVSISNLGMLGVREFAAILNPPQSAILAVGAVEDRVVAVDGSPAVRAMLTCTLSVDHRVIDGATAARLLGAIRANIEQPARMLL